MRFFAVAMLLALSTSASWATGALSNRRAPGWNLPDLKLQRYDLQDFRGKVVLIEFMSSTCPYCAQLSKTLEQVKQQLGNKIQIFGVVVYPPETQATVTKFVQEQGVTYPILFDAHQMTASYMNVTPQNPRFEVPHLFVIDGSGKIRNDYGHDDVPSLDAAKLKAYIDSLSAPAAAPAKR